MLEAGVPLLRCLNTITSGLEPRVRKAFAAVADGVSKGNSLAETMRLNPRMFSPLDVMLIDAGETSGNLGEMMGLLARWHELSGRMFRRMLAGLMLPVVVLTIAAFVVPVPKFVLGGWRVGSYLGGVAGILLSFWIPAALIFLIVRATPKTGPFRRALDP
jgi:type II secretory pathway component PulF